MNDRRGSASLMVLGILLFLSALFLGGAAFVELSVRGLERNRLRHAAHAGLRAAAEAVVDGLLSDPTPFADSPIDPVWAVLGNPRADGVSVRMEDASSRLGLNWIRKEVLEDSGTLLPGRSAREVQEFRESAGLRLDLADGFGAFVRAEALDEVFTPYGWFNINVADEFVLRGVHRSRGHDPSAAEQFHLAVQTARTSRLVIEPEALGAFLGADDYRLLFPVVNAEPPINLYFAPPAVLEILGAHFEIGPAGMRSLRDARERREITPGDLQALLGGIPNGAALAPYLGLRTWFWRVTAEKEHLRLQWIVARLPREDGTPEFRVVEERIDP